MKKLSELHNDRPINSLELSVYWTEYVMRHKGTKHLKVAIHELYWFQYYSLDVVALLVTVVLVFVMLTAKCMKLCFRTLRRKRKQEWLFFYCIPGFGNVSFAFLRCFLETCKLLIMNTTEWLSWTYLSLLFALLLQMVVLATTAWPQTLSPLFVLIFVFLWTGTFIVFFVCTETIKALVIL